MSVQRRYDVAYMQCMYLKGNQVPPRGLAAAYTAAPPPPPPALERDAHAGRTSPPPGTPPPPRPDRRADAAEPLANAAT